MGLAVQLHAQSRALGVELPLKSAGFYSIREDGVMGLEASFYLHTGSFYQVSTLGGSPEETSPDSTGGSLGLIYQRPLRDVGPVRPFWFAGSAVSYGWNTRSEIIWPDTSSWELSAGIGVAWTPLNGVALWVRQGTSVSRRTRGYVDVVRLKSDPLKALAVFMW